VDQRRITAVHKINTDLDRMADLAVDIAERALRLTDVPPNRGRAALGGLQIISWFLRWARI
jgi:phosphate uptake regulator